MKKPNLRKSERLARELRIAAQRLTNTLDELELAVFRLMVVERDEQAKRKGPKR